ncbi:hypothetical protein FSP39_003348 [Pinctada imbricata]|uniref:ascorbate ferrireductase (transmembrane) n=1 Tax=Pinctada imbricata TaxID=66713 RepID=A0AA88YAT8_PINIB|nr:hypothetical protein FSP39_003348 [Pinctada imbricata]
MVLFMYEAILVFSRESSLLIKYSHVTKANIHGYMMAGASLCASGGFAAIFYNKERNNKSHFTTWHGVVGVATLVFICLQSVGGLCLKYNSILRKFAIRLIDMKLYHATSGLCYGKTKIIHDPQQLVVFTCVVISILLAMFSDWFNSITGWTSWYACFMCLSVLAMMVMQQITNTYMPLARRSGTTPSNNERSKAKKSKSKKS